MRWLSILAFWSIRILTGLLGRCILIFLIVLRCIFALLVWFAFLMMLLHISILLLSFKFCINGIVMTGSDWLLGFRIRFSNGSYFHVVHIMGILAKALRMFPTSHHRLLKQKAALENATWFVLLGLLWVHWCLVVQFQVLIHNDWIHEIFLILVKFLDFDDIYHSHWAVLLRNLVWRTQRRRGRVLALLVVVSIKWSLLTQTWPAWVRRLVAQELASATLPSLLCLILLCITFSKVFGREVIIRLIVSAIAFLTVLNL